MMGKSGMFIELVAKALLCPPAWNLFCNRTANELSQLLTQTELRKGLCNSFLTRVPR